MRMQCGGGRILLSRGRRITRFRVHRSGFWRWLAVKLFHVEQFEAPGWKDKPAELTSSPPRVGPTGTIRAGNGRAEEVSRGPCAVGAGSSEYWTLLVDKCSTWNNRAGTIDSPNYPTTTDPRAVVFHIRCGRGGKFGVRAAPVP